VACVFPGTNISIKMETWIDFEKYMLFHDLSAWQFFNNSSFHPERYRKREKRRYNPLTYRAMFSPQGLNPPCTVFSFSNCLGSFGYSMY
jgi:hypothetical protein